MKLTSGILLFQPASCVILHSSVSMLIAGRKRRDWEEEENEKSTARCQGAQFSPLLISTNALARACSVCGASRGKNLALYTLPPPIPIGVRSFQQNRCPMAVESPAFAYTVSRTDRFEDDRAGERGIGGLVGDTGFEH